VLLLTVANGRAKARASGRPAPLAAAKHRLLLATHAFLSLRAKKAGLILANLRSLLLSCLSPSVSRWRAGRAWAVRVVQLRRGLVHFDVTVTCVSLPALGGDGQRAGGNKEDTVEEGGGWAYGVRVAAQLMHRACVGGPRLGWRRGVAR